MTYLEGSSDQSITKRHAGVFTWSPLAQLRNPSRSFFGAAGIGSVFYHITFYIIFLGYLGSGPISAKQHLKLKILSVSSMCMM